MNGVARRSSCALADLGLHEVRGIPMSRRLWAMEVGSGPRLRAKLNNEGRAYTV
jgi:hypothetical protein